MMNICYYIYILQLFFLIYILLQESADTIASDSGSNSKDALLEEACKKYDEATRLCPTLYDVCTLTVNGSYASLAISVKWRY